MKKATTTTGRRVIVIGNSVHAMAKRLAKKKNVTLKKFTEEALKKYKAS